jgi:hypothetical protein
MVMYFLYIDILCWWPSPNPNIESLKQNKHPQYLREDIRHHLKKDICMIPKKIFLFLKEDFSIISRRHGFSEWLFRALKPSNDISRQAAKGPRCARMSQKITALCRLRVRLPVLANRSNPPHKSQSTPLPRSEWPMSLPNLIVVTAM